MVKPKALVSFAVTANFKLICVLFSHMQIVVLFHEAAQILFGINAAGVVPALKRSPRTSSVVQIIVFV